MGKVTVRGGSVVVAMIANLFFQSGAIAEAFASR